MAKTKTATMKKPKKYPGKKMSKKKCSVEKVCQSERSTLTLFPVAVLREDADGTCRVTNAGICVSEEQAKLRVAILRTEPGVLRASYVKDTSVDIYVDADEDDEGTLVVKAGVLPNEAY